MTPTELAAVVLTAMHTKAGGTAAHLASVLNISPNRLSQWQSGTRTPTLAGLLEAVGAWNASGYPRITVHLGASEVVTFEEVTR
jgi:transcriptional regulator with XRE-family HTH domain